MRQQVAVVREMMKKECLGREQWNVEDGAARMSSNKPWKMRIALAKASIVSLNIVTCTLKVGANIQLEYIFSFGIATQNLLDKLTTQSTKKFEDTKLASSREADVDVLHLLDSQPPMSVLYISFGSQNMIRPKQMRELVAALESTCQPFVWTIWLPVGFDISLVSSSTSG
ncbi:hypothetical protein EJB05_05641, partial [Eragrostis curvula]